MEAARVLTVARRASLERIGLEVGVSRGTLTRWRRRFGWRMGEPGEPRSYRYGPEVKEAARVRVEGSRDGMGRIGRELGVGLRMLRRWQRHHGWQRPGPPDRPGPHFYRSKRFGRPFGADAVGTVRDLVTNSHLPLRAVAARAGVNYTTVIRWVRLRGWMRPPASPRSFRAAIERRAASIDAAQAADTAGASGAAGDAGAAGATGRRKRSAYPASVVAEARELYETTELPTRFIAARVRATRERVATWARTGGWTRPREVPDSYGRVRRGRPARPYGAPTQLA